MKTLTHLRGLPQTTLVALVALALLSGCGDNPVSPAGISGGGQLPVRLIPQEPIGDGGTTTRPASAVSTGGELFSTARDNAMLTLSLSELVQLTPYIVGDKTPENSTLSELTALTPILVKFHDAFNAEMANLSVGDVSKVTKYMESKNLIGFLYPLPEDGRGGSVKVPS